MAILSLCVICHSYQNIYASARSHGTSATVTGSTIMDVADTCHTKSVQDLRLDLQTSTVAVNPF